MKLKPSRPGLRVINPVTGYAIPEDGSFEILEMSTYWFRALQCGDVTEVQDEPPACPEKPVKINLSKTQAGGAKS